MDVSDALNAALLAAMLVNLADWAVMRRRPLVWWPSGHWWGIGLTMTLFAALLGSLRIIPSITGGLVGLPLFTCIQIGSVRMRHKRSEVRSGDPVGAK